MCVHTSEERTRPRKGCSPDTDNPTNHDKVKRLSEATVSLRLTTREGDGRTRGVAELVSGVVESTAGGLRRDPVKVVIDPGRGSEAYAGAGERREVSSLLGNASLRLTLLQSMTEQHKPPRFTWPESPLCSRDTWSDGLFEMTTRIATVPKEKSVFSEKIQAGERDPPSARFCLWTR